LWDMLQAARAVQRFVTGRTYDDYLRDELLRSGVERQLEILGEAARHLSAEFKKDHPEIPWIGIVAQRHVLAHEYGSIDHHRIWRVATARVGDLIRVLESIIPDAPDEDADGRSLF